MEPSFSPYDRLQITSMWGVWLTSLVLVLLSGVICYVLWTSLSDPDGLSRLLSDQLEMMGPAPLLSTGQAMGLTLLWLLTDFLGLVMLLQTRALFSGIRAMGIFTHTTAQRLRRIGWLVFALGPASVAMHMGSTALLSYWRDPTGLDVTLNIDDSDFYAMVIGLVIVAVGHIMVDATRIDAENRSFV